MEKSTIINFFNYLAPNWDKENNVKEAVVNRILEIADIKAGCNVLDIACGTGVMFPYYLERNINTIVGVDISPAMIEIASQKFKDCRIHLVNEDIMDCKFDRDFDRCMIFNAFPHFPDPKKLIACLADKVSIGGRLTVAHAISREALDAHHNRAASDVSINLISEKELSALFSTYFKVDAEISNNEMYIVSGCKF